MDIFLLINGLALFCCGVFLLGRRISLLVTGIKVDGKLIDWEPRGRIAHYHPVVEFQTEDGSLHRVTGMGGYSTIPKWQIDYKVIYRENEVSSAMVYSFLQFWAGPLMFLFLSVPIWWIVFK